MKMSEYVRRQQRAPFKELDFDDWCSTNCEMGFCPKSHCECKGQCLKCCNYSIFNSNTNYNTILYFKYFKLSNK